ncbi:ROK family protein [Pararhizobium sp.]|uniref:ROK family protein n=1 Tax=Pararhizobium sp. TaxID=1977563 RepID=UPI00271D3095|nr:ROK family protein [Pararhizobium sp.]MDO9417934.1 ROK family protein [Pararhizobium sp.]
MSKPTHAIGIDIGGGSTKIGLVSSEGVVEDRVRLVIEPGDDATTIVAQYAAAIREIMAHNPAARPIGIGIGFPGLIHPDNLSGTLGNIPALDDFPLAESIGRPFSLAARMENDATAAGLAEAMFGRDREAGRLLLITAGTGIGVAFTVDGKPFVTYGGCLGDAGHVIMNIDQPKRCRQGCLGCLESMASGHALNGTASSYACANPHSAIAKRAAQRGQPADASDIVYCALDGDAAAIGILDEAGRLIGRAAATWAHIFAPSVILVGGGLSAAGDLLLKPIEDEARLCGLDLYLKNVRFALASLGNDAGMIGAAAQIFLKQTA